MPNLSKTSLLCKNMPGHNQALFAGCNYGALMQGTDAQGHRARLLRKHRLPRPKSTAGKK